MVILRRFRFYLVFYVVVILLTFNLSFIATLGLSLACYNVVFFVVLLWRFTCGGDLDKQNGFDQSKISNYSRNNWSHKYSSYYIIKFVLNNWSRRYYSHYIIKFVGFISIYYAINLYIVYYL